jgi:FkbM family methyltransferase
MLHRVRDGAGAIKRWAFPRPEVAAWRKACRQAEAIPRFTPGRIQLMGYDLQYVDLLTLCPQWDGLFVKQMLKFKARQPAPRILDCGANIGLATLYFKRSYPRAKVTAFEADPAIHAVLRANLQQNGAADVEAVSAAIWTEAGEIAFRCEGADSGSIASFAIGVQGTTRFVPSLRLRDVLEQGPVDLLKLDIEGAELPVLIDCKDVLGTVGALLLDVHEFDPACRNTSAILKLLEDIGFAYTLDDLRPLPWRSPIAGPKTPFPGQPLAWALLVRAWQV